MTTLYDIYKEKSGKKMVFATGFGGPGGAGSRVTGGIAVVGNIEDQRLKSLALAMIDGMIDECELLRRRKGYNHTFDEFITHLQSQKEKIEKEIWKTLS